MKSCLFVFSPSAERVCVEPTEVFPSPKKVPSKPLFKPKDVTQGTL